MTIATIPTYPAAGAEAELELSGATGTVAVWELTAKPSASELPLGFLLLDDPTPPTSAIDAAERELNAGSFVPDVAGEYSLTAYDIRKVVGWPQYPGDPAGDQRFEILGTQSGVVDVGAYAGLPIVSETGHGATLRWLIVGDTIRAADLVDPTTEVARVAARNSSVVAALAAMVGQAASTAGTELQAGVNDLRAAFEGHRKVVGSVHSAIDSTNAIRTDDADSQEGAIDLLNSLRQVVLAHCQNSKAAGTPWHLVDDLANVPTSGPAHDLATATVLSADLRERCYERHRVQTSSPAVHGAADSTNALSAPCLLDDVVVAYLDAIASAAPSVPANESQGLADLAHRWGFTPPSST